MTKQKIAVIDAETDPFDGETFVEPFIWGFYDGAKYVQFDGPDCTYRLANYIADKKITVYAHNGGKFDFHFLLEYINKREDMTVIHNRIAKCTLGKATLQDSYCILPCKLGDMQKDDFDYSILTKDKRHIAENKKKIEVYLRHDCEYLYDKIIRFRKEYGNKLTLAGSALQEFRRINDNIDIPNSSKEFFNKFSEFYYGGRVECFKKGVFTGDYKVLDINSSYPNAMLNPHPYGLKYYQTKNPILTELKKSFVECEGFSKGAFPVKSKKGTNFPIGDGVFKVTGWEYIAAKKTKTFKGNIIKAYVFNDTLNFKSYVDYFYNLKGIAKKNNDKTGYIFAKLFLNSLYGKFGTNPEKFEDYYIDDYGEIPLPDYKPSRILKEFQLFRKPIDEDKQHYLNVATSASITGFARAYLWTAIQKCNNVLYCDTDSIIADSHDLTVGNAIGEWECEAEPDKIAIAGKKLYACFAKDKMIKKACKGVNISAHEILDITNGAEITYKNLAPSYSVIKPPSFLSRKVRMT